MDTGSVMPVDVDPRADGNMALVRTDAGWRMRTLKRGDDPQDDPRRWVSHFATCTRAADYRKPKPAGRAKLAAVPDLPAVPDVPPTAPEQPAPDPASGVLLAVDGNSVAHRAFHAYERTGMTGPDGRPLWAVYGFLVLLAGIVARTDPDAVVVGFDDPGGSVRADRYAGYKAGRPARSPDLHPQLDEIREVLAELGVQVVVPVGLEADDVLASAATAAEAAGWRCTIATSDKDAFGLITEATTVMRLTSGLDNAVTMTPDTLVEQFGVTPAQWRDYVALIGDTSDNLPGVMKIGPKTAAKLLAGCGTLDAALADPGAALAAVGKSYAGKLTADGAREAIDRNRDLMAPVRTIGVDVAGCRPTVTGGTVAKVLRGRGLPSLIDRVSAALTRPGPAEPPAEPPAGPGHPEIDAGNVLAAAGLAPAPLRTPGPALRLVQPPAPERQPIVRAAPPKPAPWVPTYPYQCMSPGHGDRPARLYPGGRFCDGCAEKIRR